MLDEKTKISTTRITELDGIRGVAILMVLVWHYIQNQIVPQSTPYLMTLKDALVFTWSGVDLFFVLSGFLIGGILLDNRESENYFKTFYIRRTLRIFPIYYLYLLLYVILISLGIQHQPLAGWVFDPGNMPLWSYATYTQNIMMAINNEAGPQWLNVTWSLAVEEQFYLFLPFIIRYVPKERLPIILLWFIIAAPVLRTTLPGLSAYINAPWRADCLLLGVLLAYAVRIPGFWEMANNYRRAIYAVFIGLIAGVVVMSTYSGLTLGGTYTHLLFAALYTTLLLVILMNREGNLTRILRFRSLVWLGTISYGAYLIHQAVSGIMHSLLRQAYPGLPDLEAVMVTTLCVLVTLLLAHLSYSFFERRIIGYGHTFRYSMRKL